MRMGQLLSGLLVALAALATTGDSKAVDSGKISINKTTFGKTNGGAAVDLYTLTNSRGMVVKIMSLGATITEILVPDRKGTLDDVVLGFSSVKGFQQKGNPFFGCTVGRYANRIAAGRFTLDGTEYKLAKNNDGKHHLHGGDKGFDKYVWEWKRQATFDKGEGAKNFAEVAFQHVSPDKDEGFPGELKAQVTFTLNDENELVMKYEATTDKATVVNLTNHAYFNLKGQASGKSVLDHEVQLYAGKYTPVDAEAIPTGKIADVAGTPFDFIKPHTIKERIAKVPGLGYDHNFVIDGGGKGKLVQAARVIEKMSGRILDVLTTEPGIQFYTGNYLDGSLKGKGGAVYQKHAGFCLEAQKYPDTPNQKGFPSAVLKPGEIYRQTTVYKFAIIK